MEGAARIAVVSPQKIGRHLEENIRSDLKVNLFISHDDSESLPKKQRTSSMQDANVTSRTETKDFAAMSIEELQEHFPELKKLNQNKVQPNRIINPDLFKFVSKLVCNTKRKERSPLQAQQEVEEWCNFCTDLFEEVQTRRKVSTLSEVIKSEKLRNVQKDKTYAG